MKRFATVKLVIVEAAFNTKKMRFDIKPYREFDYILCNNTRDPKIVKMVKQIVSVPGFEEFNICPSFQGQEEDFVVFDNYENYTHKWASIKFYPCSLPDPSQCASPEEFKELRTDYGFPFKLLETTDSDNPVRSSPFRRSVKLDRRSKKVIKEIVKLNKVLDYTYSMIPPTLKQEFATLQEDIIDSGERNSTQLYCTPEQLSMPAGTPGACEEYLSFDYEAMGEVLVTRRSYKSLMSILGEFGGILKVLTTGTFFLYGFYNMRKIKHIIGDLVFKRDKKSSKTLKKIIEGKKSKENPKKDNEVVVKPVSSSRQGLAQNQKLEEASSPKLNEVILSLVETRSNVEDLMKKLNLVDLIEKALFKDHEKALLPLVLLKVEQREMMEQKKKKMQQKIEAAKHRNHAINAIFAKKSPEDSRKDNPFQAAFNDLVNSDPEDYFNKRIKDYLLSELQGVFDSKKISNHNLSSQNQKKIKLRSNLRLKVVDQHHQYQKIDEDGQEEKKGMVEIVKKIDAQTVKTPLTSVLGKRFSSGHLRPKNSPLRLKSRLSVGLKKQRKGSPLSKLATKKTELSPHRK